MVKQERAALTRRSLVQAAAEVFAREGFVTSALTSISRKAGVSNGALHFHFESKQALAAAVEEEAAAVVGAITRAGPAGGGPVQQLIDATHVLMERLEHDVVLRAGFELATGAPRREHAADLRGLWQHWVEQVLAQAEREGALAAGVSAADAALTVVAATVGFEQLAGADRSWLSADTLVRFWDLVLPRLAAPGVLGRLLSGGTHRAAPTPL